MGLQQAQERDARAELVDKEGRGCELGELIGEQGDLQYEVDLAQDGAENGKAAKDSSRNDGVAVHTNVEGAFASAESQLPFLA